jgi:hypothetical protein
MPNIALPEGLPGISAGFAFRPETAKPMRELAHVLLHGPSTLTLGERELKQATELPLHRTSAKMPQWLIK